MTRNAQTSPIYQGPIRLEDDLEIFRTTGESNGRKIILISREHILRNGSDFYGDER